MRRLPASTLLLCLQAAVWVLHGSHAGAQTLPPEPTIVDVRIEQEGKPVDDPAITSLIETRVGQPLSMRDVRETMAHLISLNRFENIEPLSEPVANGVRVTWVLEPLHPVDRIEFTGMTGLPTGDLRRALTERFAGFPTEGHVDEAREMLLMQYRRRGYPNAKVMARIEPTHNPDRATLYFDVVAGMRARIMGLRMTQLDANGQTNLADVPDIKDGQPYDEDAIQKELTAWENRMRNKGFYEARATHGVQWVGDSAAVFVNLTRGPHVRIAFAGDPLPQSEKDRLVPVREQGSADEDLLEDSSRAIENFLHQRGYRDATAPFTRDESDGELVITFTVKRGLRYVVRNVQFTGNESIPTAQLQDLVRLRDGEPFVRATLDAGIQAIVNTFRLGGFTRVQIKHNENVVLPENLNVPDRGVDVTVAIDEGPRSIVREVTFKGNEVLSEADLQRMTVVSPGRAFVAGEMVSDRDRIATEYRNRGYESVAVTSEPQFAENDTRVTVHFTISEGPQSIVDHIIIVGNHRTSNRTIERELTVRPGEPLGEAALVESRTRLAALQLFRRVSIEPVAHGSETRRDVLIQVEEAPATVLGMGGGVEGGFEARPGPDGNAEERFEVAPRGFFQIGRRNLWGKNRTINLFTRVSLRPTNQFVDTAPVATPTGQTSYGFNEYRVVPTYSEPRVFGLRSNLQVQGILEQAVRVGFNFRRRELRAQGDLAVSQRYHLTGFYSLQRVTLFDITDFSQIPLIDRTFPTVRLSKFSGSLSRDTRDDLFDPSIGTFSIISGDLAAHAIGSQVGFVKTYLQGFWYRRLPVPRRVVLALGARVGVAHGFEQLTEGEVISDLPASERFFAGGPTSVRGFSLDRLVNEQTVTPTGFPTGGDSVVIFNTELRVALFGQLQAAGFVDAGNVFPRASDLDFTDLRPTPGFGLIYRSPVGPIRVDLGFNPNPMKFGTDEERSWVWHILLGQAF